MGIDVKVIGRHRVARLTGTGTMLELPAKVINTTEENYTSEMHELGWTDFSYSNPLREIVTITNSDKLREFGNPSKRRSFVEQCNREMASRQTVTMLEFQLHSSVAAVTSQVSSMLVEIGMESNADIVKVATKGMSIQEFETNIRRAISRIQQSGKKAMVCLDMREKPAIFARLCAVAAQSEAFGISFRFGTFKSNRLNYLHLGNQYKGLGKLLHLSTMPTRDWHFHPQASAQNIAATFVDTVSLEAKKWFPPYEDIPADKAEFLCETDCGFYTRGEYATAFGTDAEFRTNTNFELFEAFSNLHDITEHYHNERECLNPVVKVFNAQAVSKELENLAASRRQGEKAVAEYIESREFLRANLARF